MQHEVSMKLKPEKSGAAHIPLLQEMDLTFVGNPEIIANMVAGAMGANQGIAFAFAYGVITWCKQNRIDPASLEDMLGKGPVSNPGTIITQ